MPSTNSAVHEAIVAYVPALHAGYISFIKKHPHVDVFVLGKSFIDAYPRLNRDIRALLPKEAVLALEALTIVPKVLVLEISDKEVLKKYNRIILPDEDVSRDFAKKYLSEPVQNLAVPDLNMQVFERKTSRSTKHNSITMSARRSFAAKNIAFSGRGKILNRFLEQKIEFESIFLRWDGVFSDKENEVPPDRTITTDLLDQELMRHAIKEGERSADWWRQVGAVLVKSGKAVSFAHIRYFPSDLALDIFGTPRITVDAGERSDLYISMHAEAGLIAEAAKAGESLLGASLYVSTFPCINCAFLIARSGIARVYYAKGYSRLDALGVFKQADIEIILVKV